MGRRNLQIRISSKAMGSKIHFSTRARPPFCAGFPARSRPGSSEKCKWWWWWGGGKPLNLWLLLLILFPIPYFFSAPYFDSEPPSKPGGGRPGSEIPLRSVTYSVRSHSFYISAPYFVPRSLFLSAPYSYFEPPPLPGGGRIPSPYFVSRSLFSSAPYFRERPVGVHQPLESAHEGPGRVSRGGFGPSPTFYSRSHGFSFFPRGRQAFSAAPRGAGIASARPLIARQSGAGPAGPKRVAPAVPAFCLFPRGAA